MKWLDKLNERAPDDLKRNIVECIFWAVIFGVAAGIVVMT